MPSFRETQDFEDVTCEAETTDAILCLIEEKKVWIPKSHVADGSEVTGKGDEGTLTVSQWIAEQKDLV